MIRTLWVGVFTVVATLFYAPIVIGAGVLRIRNQKIYDWAARTWSRKIIRAAGSHVRIEGLENVHMDEPQVLVGNHQSWFDVWTLAASLPKTFHFVAKKELERIIIFGRAWKTAGHISIDRSNQSSAIQSLEQAGQQLRREKSAVIMFAEGTRSPTDELLPFKKGPFMLAIRSGVPIVPFALAGTRRVLPKGSWRVRPSPIILRFGQPIPTEQLSEADRETLIQRVRDEVRRMRDEARRELGPGRLEAGAGPS